MNFLFSESISFLKISRYLGTLVVGKNKEIQNRIYVEGIFILNCYITKWAKCQEEYFTRVKTSFFVAATERLREGGNSLNEFSNTSRYVMRKRILRKNVYLFILLSN